MKTLPALTVFALVALLSVGCATTEQREESRKKQSTALSEAPLGSRIKNRTGVAPVVGANREDLDAYKTQQGAIQQQIVNDGGR